MALQICQLTADAPKVSDDRKSFTTANKNDFGKFLENIKKLIKKPLADKTKENNTDVLLMQLLNLLNIDISWRDLETMLNEQLLNPNMNLDKIEFDMKVPADELYRCWQAIIAEFNATGDINQDTVKKFYLAMKKALTYDADFDVSSLKNTISEILKSSNEKVITFDHNRLEKFSDNDLQEKSSIAFETKSVENDENANSEKPGTHQIKQKTKTDIPVKDEQHQNKELIFKDNTAVYDNYEEHNQFQINSNLLHHDTISPSFAQKNFTTLNKVDSNIITVSAKSYDTLDVFEQLIDKVRFALKGDVQEIKVRLKPDYLGDVLIKVISDKGRLKAELFVENSQIRSMLRVNALDFQNQIREQGYNFSEINVYKMSDSLEMGAFNHQSSSNEHYQAKKSKSGINRNQTDSQLVAVTDNYSLWENTSKVNYMA